MVAGRFSRTHLMVFFFRSFSFFFYLRTRVYGVGMQHVRRAVVGWAGPGEA